MKPAKYLLITSSGSRSRTRVWNTKKPAPLGHPKVCVLESTERGFRIRSIESGATQEFTPSQIQKGISLVAPRVKLRLANIHHPRAAFRDLPIEQISVAGAGASNQKARLFVYTTLAQWMLRADPVDSAFVGMIRTTPAFTLSREGQSYRIKFLCPGMRIKIRGRPIRSGSVDESFELSKMDLANALIFRRAHSWRFNFVLERGRPIEEFDPVAIRDGEVFWSRVSSMLSILMLLGLFTLAYFAPKKKIADELIPAQYAKIIFESKPTIEPAKHEKLPEPPKVVEVQKIRDHTPIEPNPKKPEKDASGAKVKKPIEAPKLAKKPVDTKAEAPKLGTPEPPKPPKDVLKAQELQSAVANLLNQNPNEGVLQNLANTDSARQPQTLFESKSELLKSSPTVLPAGKLNNAKVEKIGTGGGAALGYEKGDRPVLPNQGSGLLKLGAINSEAGGASVDEGLEKSEVGNVINAHLGEIRYCYESAALNQAKIEGKLVVHFMIGPEGKVKSADSVSSTLPDSRIDSCVVKRLKGWTFPKPRGGTTVSVTYPFVFRTLGKGE